MAAYGDGSIFQRRGIYYAKLFVRGRRKRESLHTRDEDVARRRLASLRRQRDRGLYQDPAIRRITVAELLDDLVAHLKAKGAAGVAIAEYTLKPVREAFSTLEARDLDTAAVEGIQAAWLQQGKARATVNRRCELLRQAYRLASRRTPPKVLGVPYVPRLNVTNARQGFLAPDEIERLLASFRARDADARDFVEWFGWTGMRPGEIRKLTWRMVDLKARTLNLDPRAAKTRKGRVIGLEGPLWTIIERRLGRRRLGCELVFHRPGKLASGRGWAPGQPIRDIAEAFAAAAKRAGLPEDLVPYDLRRSALRNMKRAGAHETVIMGISGHRTRSTFDRYNITDESDTRAAIAAAAAARDRRQDP
jgi:integrase